MSIRSSISEKSCTVIASTFNLIPESSSSSSYNDSFLSSHSESAPHTQAALCVRNILTPETQPQNEKSLISTLDLENTSLEEARRGLNILRLWQKSKPDEGASIEEYKRRAQERWPKAALFEKELPWDRLQTNAGSGLLLGF